MRSTIALVVRRWRAEPLVVVLVQLTTLIATVVVAAVPMYSTAVGVSTVTTALESTTSAERTIELSTRVPARDLDEAARVVSEAATAALPNASEATFVRTDQFRAGEVALEFGALVDGDDLYRTADARPARESSRLPVALHVAGAARAGLGLGDVLTAERGDVSMAVEIVELVEPIDLLDDRWLDDELFRDGLVEFGDGATVGPFLVDAEALSELDALVRIDHRRSVESAALDPDDLEQVVGSIRRAPDRAAAELAGALGDTTVVEARIELDEVLADIDARLSDGRPVVSIVLLQVAAVALVAVGLAASITVAGRRRDVAVQRLRGASTEQLVGAALVEAVLLVAPTVVLAPFLARLAIAALDAVGPLADLGLEAGRAGTAPFLAAAAVGVAAVALIVAPSVPRRRAHHRHRRPVDLGIDLVVAVGAVLAIFRLTRSADDQERSTAFFGADPVQVLAPALGVLAASLLALRVVRLGSALAARWSRRADSAVVHLAAANLVRRPATVGRIVTVSVLAVATGVLSLVLASSWERSQRDRADATVSSDVRVDIGTDVAPAGAGDGVDPGFRVAAVRRVAEVDAAMPVDRTTGSFASNTVEVAAVAIGASSADGIIRSPGSLTSGLSTFGVLEGSSSVGGVDVSAAADDVDTIDLSLEIDAVSPELDRPVMVVLLVRDGDGTIHRLTSTEVPPEVGPSVLSFSLLDPAGSGAVLGGPLQVVGLDVEVPMQFASRQDTLDPEVTIEQFEVRLRIESLTGATTSVVTSSAWEFVGVAPVGSTATAPTVELADAVAPADGLVLDVDTGVSVARRSSAVVPLRIPGAAASSSPIPAIVTEDLARTLGARIGSELPLRLDRLTVGVEVVGVVERVPFATDAARSVLVDWSTLEDRRFAITGSRDAASSVAASVAEGEVDAVTTAAGDAGVDVTDRWSAARANGNDPVALSLLGALSIAAIGGMAVALVVLTLSSVAAARERRADAAALRALGLPAGTVRRAALVEIVPAVLLAVAMAITAAVAIAGLVLTEVTIGDDGVAAVPDAVLVIPIGPIALIATAIVVVGVLSPLLVAGLLGRVDPASELRAGAPT